MKTCPECNEKIIGRDDKKFCSDGCRNTFNNRINKDSSNFMRNINNKLRKNYRILAELNAAGKTKTTKSDLSEKGFDFMFFTNIHTTKAGNIYRCVYDHGYRILKNDHHIVVKKE